MSKLTLSLIILFAGTIGSAAKDNRPSVQLPGQRADGSVLLPNQWSLRPVGRQIELGDFPINIAMHPQGRFAAILHSGYSHHGIMVVDLATERVVTNVPLEEAFYGIVFSRNGSRLFCSGASEEVIHSFHFKDGLLSHQTGHSPARHQGRWHSRRAGPGYRRETALRGKLVWSERIRSRFGEGNRH